MKRKAEPIDLHVGARIKCRLAVNLEIAAVVFPFGT